jgi:2-C-methyl-D-erythritol 4-phosphate cytidylyltransferase
VEFFTGCRVKLVKASYRNIKVTTPEDLVTVLAYLKEKQEPDKQ